VAELESSDFPHGPHPELDELDEDESLDIVVVDEEELLEYVNELVPHELELELELGQELELVELGQELELVELGQELELVELGQELDEELEQELDEELEQELEEELDEELDEEHEVDKDAEQLTVSLLLLQESELKPVTEHNEQVVELLELELGKHLDFLGIIYI
jgi:hypothetical protein